MAKTFFLICTWIVQGRMRPRVYLCFLERKEFARARSILNRRKDVLRLPMEGPKPRRRRTHDVYSVAQTHSVLNFRKPVHEQNFTYHVPLTSQRNQAYEIELAPAVCQQGIHHVYSLVQTRCVHGPRTRRVWRDTIHARLSINMRLYWCAFYSLSKDTYDILSCVQNM